MNTILTHYSTIPHQIFNKVIKMYNNEDMCQSTKMSRKSPLLVLNYVHFYSAKNNEKILTDIIKFISIRGGTQL